MNRDPPTDPGHGSTLCTPEHGNLIGMLERLHEMILVREDAGMIEDALGELAALARCEFAIEESLLRRSDPSHLAAHRSRNVMFLAKLQLFRLHLGSGASGIDRGKLYDFLSEWLVHSLCEP
jgi:hemerythrin